jgi:23S rRNA pseudouridine955/2504/2580 synthase
MLAGRAGMEQIKIGKNDEGQRADKFLKKYLSRASAGFIYRMIRKKQILINGGRLQPSDILSEGDILQLNFLVDGLSRNIEGNVPDKAGMDFSVAYEDKNILVADKPAGLLSHPDGSRRQTLIDQILFYLYKKGEYDPKAENSFVPALCNRLDRNTGGLVICAKNFRALQDINDMIHNRQIQKYYMAVVKGTVTVQREITGYLSKDGLTNKVRITNDREQRGKEIFTRYRPLKPSSQGYTLLEVELITGRPHQIRAHLAAEGLPIIGDEKYGDRTVNLYFKQRYGLNGQLLFAYRIKFGRGASQVAYLEGREVNTMPPPVFAGIIRDLF